MATQKKNYVKVEDLKSDDAKKCREKTRERVRKHRQAKKEMTKNVNRLMVAMDFRKKKAGNECPVKFLKKKTIDTLKGQMKR